MQTQVYLDDRLLSQAQALSGVQDYDRLLQYALSALIQQESAKQLTKLAGSQPCLNDVPRQREISP
jgi:hypothetical protein